MTPKSISSRHDAFRNAPRRCHRRDTSALRPTPWLARWPTDLGPLRSGGRSQRRDAGRHRQLGRRLSGAIANCCPCRYDVEPVTLGEGMSPLLPCPRLGESLGLQSLARQGRIATADRQLQEPRHDRGRQHGEVARRASGSRSPPRAMPAGRPRPTAPGPAWKSSSSCPRTRRSSTRSR